MKIKSLALSVATAVILPVAGLSGAALADSPGQIDGGDIYRVKNLTKNTDFANTTTADACEQLQYKVRLHNSGFGNVTNIVVKATLSGAAATSNTSNMTATYESPGPEHSISDSATVNLTSVQSISYLNGTTQLLDKDNNVVNSLPDGITGGGVNAGTLAGSTAEFVQFKAKVNCPTPPKPPVTPPSTPPATPAAPTTLVNTGPGETAALFAIAMIAGTLGYRKYLSYRLGRQ
jgi:hypothetical protein